MSSKQNRILILNKDLSINNIITKVLNTYECVLITNEQEFIDKLRSDFDIIIISDVYATNQYRLIEKVLLSFKGLFIVITNNKDSFNSPNIKKISDPINVMDLRDLIHEYEDNIYKKSKNLVLNKLKELVSDNNKLVNIFDPINRISGLIYIDKNIIKHSEYENFVGNEAIRNILSLNNPLISVFENVKHPITTCEYILKENKDTNKIFKGKSILISKNTRLKIILKNIFESKNIDLITLEEINNLDNLELKKEIQFILFDETCIQDYQKFFEYFSNIFDKTQFISIGFNIIKEYERIYYLNKTFNLQELDNIIEFFMSNMYSRNQIIKYNDNINRKNKIISIKMNDDIGLVYINDDVITHCEYQDLMGIAALKDILKNGTLNLAYLPWSEPIITTLNIVLKNKLVKDEIIHSTLEEVSKEDNRKKILIVDDDNTSTKILGKFLSSKNYITKTANSAIDGEKILLQEKFDLVITDINMPKVSGLEFLLWIKEHFPEIKVIIITSFHDETIKAFSNQKGAFYYFEKPVDLNEIESLLEKAFLDPNYSDLKVDDFVKVSIVSKLNKIIEVTDIYTRKKSYIYIKNGRIIHAESGELKGLEALHEIFRSESGIFSDIPWKEPKEVSINYNDLLLFTPEDPIEIKQIESIQQTATEKLHSIVEKIRHETNLFNKYTIYEEGVALEIILGKTTKKEVLKIMEEYSSEKFKFDDVSQILIYQDLSLTILFNEKSIVTEMRFGKLYKGSTYQGIKIGDTLEKGIEIYGKPDVYTLKGAIWKNIALFSSDGITITSIRIRQN